MRVQSWRICLHSGLKEKTSDIVMKRLGDDILLQPKKVDFQDAFRLHNCLKESR